ncbi:MAG: hypothetical protein HGA96_04910 [Desulfobulbaceae bacterium]|nr:hypothetical protein [Desulfobulbaceae bacterium]
MNKAMKAGVLSGLVLPGLGQLVLRHYLRGAFLVLACLACLALLIAQAVTQAQAIIGRLDPLNVAIDPAALLAEVSRGASAAGPSTGLASWALLFIWLGGTIDAYLLGRKEDLRERAEGAVR